MSMLDGHPQIQCQPGEDFLLREFISRAKENETKLVDKIKNLRNVNYITQMSRAYTNKWKKLYLAWKNKKKLNHGLDNNQLTKVIFQTFKILFQK